MEIIGDDKKLRALYSDARVADETATPGFTSVWHRAQSHRLRPRRAFNLSFALVTALLVLTLGSLAVWSMYSPRRDQRDEARKSESTPGGVAPAAGTSPEKANTNEAVKTAENSPQPPIETPVHRAVKPRVKRPAAPGESQLLASNQTTKDTTIESWESPTSTLLSSPTDGLFKSVPQLNENANEMKSFLPGRSNDKEK
jgi:type IV secretory pathway VirB10-like protein